MKLTTRQMTHIALTASVYAALTLFLPFPAHGMIQFRLSEIMNLLAFINPSFAPGIILGCFISNIFSSVNPVLDCVFGTAATAVTMLFIIKFSKNLFIASLWPTVFCVFVGAMIMYADAIPWTLVNFSVVTGNVMLGEFVVMTVIGYPLFKLLMQNNKFISFLKKNR